MKTNIKTIRISLIFTLLLAVLSNAQILTVTGNYCARTKGNKAAAFAFVVDSGVLIAEMKFGGQRGTAKMVRFNVKKLRIGDEFIIKYDDTDVMGPTILAITETGRRKSIKPCKR